MSREMTPTEERAVARVKRAIADLPDTLWIYFHGGDADVLACDESGQPCRDGRDFDREAILTTIPARRTSAGDW